MGYENRISELLDRNNIEFYWEDDHLVIPEGVGADKIFQLMDQEGGFYSYPTVQEVVNY